MEFDDYLVYSTTLQEEIEVPQRSPRRPHGKDNGHEPCTTASPSSVLDASSFEPGWRSSMDESIFSHDNVSRQELDEVFLDDEDLDVVFREMDDDIIFEVDDIVNVVGIHVATG